MKKVTCEMIENYLYNHVCNLTEENKVEYWNRYCESKDKYENIIHCNFIDEINGFFKTPAQALESIQDNDYCFDDYYFTFDFIHGLSSFNFLTDDKCPFDIDELVVWLASSKPIYHLIESALEKED